MNKPFSDKQVTRLGTIADKLNELSLEIEDFKSTLELMPVEEPVTSQDLLIARGIAYLDDAERASSIAVYSIENFIYGILPKFK